LLINSVIYIGCYNSITLSSSIGLRFGGF
jgi:hypothetical protein